MFPLTAMMNHSCQPSISRSITTTTTGPSLTFRMRVVAARALAPGQQIYNSYIDILDPVQVIILSTHYLALSTQYLALSTHYQALSSTIKHYLALAPGQQIYNSYIDILDPVQVTIEHYLHTI